jgi:abequosyltransferase
VIARPRLAICLFTHNGRREVLSEALASVFQQLSAPGLSDVEVCVSDNASSDGTESLMAELAREHGERLRYLRHDRDLGLSRNLLACVELARSDYCWILTSDDAIESGGIARVLELIALARQPPGVVVNKANFDSRLVELASQGASDFHPPEQRRTIQYDEADQFISDCGLLTSLVSTLIVRRDNWLQAVAELGGVDYAATTIFPHLPVIARMARRDPRWVWCPAKLVRVRMDNAFLASDEGWSVDQIHTRLLRDMSRMWNVYLGRSNRVRLSLLTRAYKTFAARRVLRTTAPEGRSVRARLTLLRAYGRLFWWVPAFWLETVPGLLLDGWSTRSSAIGGRKRPLPLDQRLARVKTRGAPFEVATRDEISLALEIENAGSTSFSPHPPFATVVGYRWHGPQGDVVLQGPPLAIPRKLSPGRSSRCDLEVLTPAEPGTYRLQIALAQQDVGWFDDRDPQLACWLSLEARAYGWADRPQRP